MNRDNFRGKICRHCHKADVKRPRGLCWACYYTPGVLALYPSTSPYARRGLGQDSNYVKAPRRPTKAPPGTTDKVRVMQSRCKRGLALHHPGDAKDFSHVAPEAFKKLRLVSSGYACSEGGNCQPVQDHDDSELDATESERGDG